MAVRTGVAGGVSAMAACLPLVGGGDENGDELVEALDTFATAVRDK